MELSYLIREPEHVTPDTQLLILLHGYGSNEEDLFSFAGTLPKDWLIVSFRAPVTLNFGGYAWFEINFTDPNNRADEGQARNALNLVLEGILNIQKKYSLTKQVHLCGFSQGGMLCYALALKNPQIFSKVACLSTYPESKLLTESSKDKAALAHLRFFISHGTEDAVIPIDWARKAAEMLYDLSCYFTFREYVEGHGVNQKNYMDLMEFFGK